MNKEKGAVFLSLSYFLFTFGYIVSRGFYHVGELAIILSVTLILFVFYLKPQILDKLNLPGDQKSLSFILSIILIINVALVGAHLGDASQTNWRIYSAANRILASLAFFFSLSYFLKKTADFLLKIRLPTLICLAFLIRIFAIISAPNPTIDVFYILRDGPKEILAGRNPYQMSYPSPYGVYIPSILFVYGPLTPFLFLPSVVLFNDPRYTLVLVDLLSTFLLYKIAKKLILDKIYWQPLILIFLFHPLFPFMTEQAWLEPVMTLFLLSAVYLLTKYPQKIWSGVFLGAILAIKSVYLLPLLTLLKNRKANIAQYSTTILIPLILSLPFLLADPKLFLERTQVYVSDPTRIQSNLAPTNISLSIAAVILKYTGYVLPTAVIALAGLVTSIIVIAKGPKTPPFALISTFLVFTVLFMFGPFVFLHYFAFLGNILLLSTLLFLGQKHKI